MISHEVTNSFFLLIAVTVVWIVLRLDTKHTN